MGPENALGLLPGRLGVNEEPSDESESDSEREPVNWRGRQTQRSWPKTEPAMVTPTDHILNDDFDEASPIRRLQKRASHRAAAAYTRKGEDINTYLTNFRYLCSRFREPLPYENQVAIAFRGIRPEYRNFIAHREISSFKELEKSGKEYEKLCRMNAYWHEPVTHANQLHPRAAYKPVQARQCAAVEVSSPKAEGSSNKKSKKRKSPKKKPTSPPRTPPKEVAALEKTQAPQSNRYGERRTQWKNSNLQPSGGAIRKELRCTNCKQQGHWTTNCPTIECFKCHKKGHMARACPESEDNVERKDIACQVCGPKRCNGAGVRPLQLLVRPFGKRAGGGAGSVAVPLKSHTRPKESDRADDALIRWLYRLEQQDKLKVPTLGEVLAHCEWPRDDTLIPMPGGGTISEWCLRDLSAAGERPAGQADEGIEKIAEPCETRKQNAWSQGEFVTLELGGEAEESTQKKNRMRRGDKARDMRISKHSRLVDICQFMLQIDREAGRIDMECTEILPVEMVLGVDFGRRWRVDISMGRNQWRSGDGPWHNFAKLNEARSMRCDIVAECAGITVCGGEREIIESKIKRLIPDVPPKLGHTDKIVHRIELVEGAKPVCHRTRRMTPKMEKIAHECLQKMKEEGIIEPAKSEWNSAPVLMERNTNEEQRRSFAAVVRGATGRTAPSVRPAMDGRAGASSSERNASEEARASQEAFLRGLRCTHRRTRWTGRSPFSPAITAGNGRRGNNERTPTEEELPVSVDRPAARGTRQRTPSPGEGTPARTEEESRCWRRRHGQCWSSWWRPVNRWKNGTARHSRRFFVARLKRKFLLLEEGEATATLRRSGETTEESARVPTPPLAPVQEPSALPLPPPVQQVSYVAGLHGLVFQPFAVQQQRLPQTEYPLDGQQQRQLRRPGPYQEQQQHRQLPRRQPQQHQREEVRVEVRPLSPVAGPSSLSGNTAAPARIQAKILEAWSRWGSCRGLTLRAERVLSVTNLDTLAASFLNQLNPIKICCAMLLSQGEVQKERGPQQRPRLIVIIIVCRKFVACYTTTISVRKMYTSHLFHQVNSQVKRATNIVIAPRFVCMCSSRSSSGSIVRAALYATTAPRKSESLRVLLLCELRTSKKKKGSERMSRLTRTSSSRISIDTTRRQRRPPYVSRPLSLTSRARGCTARTFGARVDGSTGRQAQQQHHHLTPLSCSGAARGARERDYLLISDARTIFHISYQFVPLAFIVLYYFEKPQIFCTRCTVAILLYGFCWEYVYVEGRRTRRRLLPCTPSLVYHNACTHPPPTHTNVQTHTCGEAAAAATSARMPRLIGRCTFDAHYIAHVHYASCDDDDDDDDRRGDAVPLQPTYYSARHDTTCSSSRSYLIPGFTTGVRDAFICPRLLAMYKFIKGSPPPSPQRRSYAQATEICYTDEMAIVMDALDGIKYTDYLKILKNHIDPKKMKYASRISNKRVCVYMDSIESAELLINKVKEIVVNGNTVGIRPLKSPNKRVVISNVSPVISDQVLMDSLAKMGIKPVSRMNRLKITTDDPDLAHISCHRRQVYIKAEDEDKLLPAITLRRGEQTKHVYFSTSNNTRCFNCNEEGHQARHCRQGRPESTENENENDSLAQEKARPAEIETTQPQSIASSADVGNTPTKPFEIFSQPFNKKRFASPTTSQFAVNGNAQGVSPYNTKPAKKPRLKKSRKDESKPSLEDITSQITQAFAAQGGTDIDIRAPTLAKFLHDSHGQRDITSAIEATNCKVSVLDNALMKIRNSMPSRNLKDRIRRLRWKINGEDINTEDSVDEEYSSMEESSFTTDIDHAKTPKVIFSCKSIF
ncbi:unnamed protein product [Trichogramma brassicae]|uniref:CCHC-type domain-containing protein n=1 Tax=Trichogramma brassicae TaxID=86971 RepID=A0A6H5HUD8_9HYME|nr:unnamed protein product [Trichogramma brassicae]